MFLDRRASVEKVFQVFGSVGKYAVWVVNAIICGEDIGSEKSASSSYGSSGNCLNESLLAFSKVFGVFAGGGIWWQKHASCSLQGCAYFGTESSCRCEGGSGAVLDVV